MRNRPFDFGDPNRGLCPLIDLAAGLAERPNRLETRPSPVRCRVGKLAPGIYDGRPMEGAEEAVKLLAPHDPSRASCDGRFYYRVMKAKAASSPTDRHQA